MFYYICNAKRVKKHVFRIKFSEYAIFTCMLFYVMNFIRNF